MKKIENKKSELVWGYSKEDHSIRTMTNEDLSNSIK